MVFVLGLCVLISLVSLLQVFCCLWFGWFVDCVVVFGFCYLCCVCCFTVLVFGLVGFSAILDLCWYDGFGRCGFVLGVVGFFSLFVVLLCDLFSLVLVITCCCLLFAGFWRLRSICW